MNLRHRHALPLTRPAVLSGRKVDQTRESGENRAQQEWREGGRLGFASEASKKNRETVDIFGKSKAP